ncbi:hypothetical protein [Subtercola boreus]|uniref:DUF8175 domain-containing protein n=1 Tax=Subtercola boreus TaxID=120213 RepID=A0A3E0W5Y5_9MICO|nr:hypothetical protein [Subtercola boreus]RFA17760.1 hypothetical protein B7R24_16420 [Subtercola boreus]RFA17800.1 hypothetical protein B7R23_16590 [Subtercola boreus]RFA24538.1 hypothetical protein B7R25_16580 [Subtercola boreus]
MSDAEPRNPFTRRGFILGGVLIAGLAAAAITLAFTSVHGDPGATAVAPTSTPVVTATADPATASVCGLPGYDTTNTLTATPETKWEIVGTMAAPGSTTIGPGITGADGVRSCYAHTAAGAVFAVANFWAMGTDIRLAPLVTAQSLVPGPGRDAAMAMKTTQGSTGTSAQVAGFKVLSYDGTDATIDVVLETSTGTDQLFSFPVPMRWSGGDWKLVVTDDGQQVFRPTALQSLGGYTPWAGLK